MMIVRILLALSSWSLWAQVLPMFQEGGHFHRFHDGKILVQSRPGVWTPVRQALPPIPELRHLTDDAFDGRVLYRVMDAPGGTRCVLQGGLGMKEGRPVWQWESPVPLPEGVRLVAASQGRLYLRRNHSPASSTKDARPSSILTAKDTRVELLRFDVFTRKLEILESYPVHPFYVQFQAMLLEGDVCIVANTGLVTRYDGVTGARTVLVEDFVTALPGKNKRGIHRQPPRGDVVEVHPWLMGQMFPDHEGNLCFGVMVIQQEEESALVLVDRLKASSEAFQRTNERLGLTEATIRSRSTWELDRQKVAILVVNPVTRRVKTLDREAYDHLLKDEPYPFHGEPDRLFSHKGNMRDFYLWMDPKEKIRSSVDLGSAEVPKGRPDSPPTPTPTQEPPPSGPVAQP